MKHTLKGESTNFNILVLLMLLSFACAYKSPGMQFKP